MEIPLLLEPDKFPVPYNGNGRVEVFNQITNSYIGVIIMDGWSRRHHRRFWRRHPGVIIIVPRWGRRWW